MATLDPPLGRLAVGTTYKLQANLFGWRTVGSCTVTESSPFRFAASGDYDVMGRRGDFDLALALSDENATATSGPCTVSALGRNESGTYRRDGDQITFQGAGQRITVSPGDEDAVLLGIGGFPEVRIVR